MQWWQWILGIVELLATAITVDWLTYARHHRPTRDDATTPFNLDVEQQRIRAALTPSNQIPRLIRQVHEHGIVDTSTQAERYADYAELVRSGIMRPADADVVQIRQWGSLDPIAVRRLNAYRIPPAIIGNER